MFSSSESSLVPSKNKIVNDPKKKVIGDTTIVSVDEKREPEPKIANIAKAADFSDLAVLADVASRADLAVVADLAEKEEEEDFSIDLFSYEVFPVDMKTPSPPPKPKTLLSPAMNHWRETTKFSSNYQHHRYYINNNNNNNYNNYFQPHHYNHKDWINNNILCPRNKRLKLLYEFPLSATGELSCHLPFSYLTTSLAKTKISSFFLAYSSSAHSSANLFSSSSSFSAESSSSSSFPTLSLSSLSTLGFDMASTSSSGQKKNDNNRSDNNIVISKTLLNEMDNVRKFNCWILYNFELWHGSNYNIRINGGGQIFIANQMESIMHEKMKCFEPLFKSLMKDLSECVQRCQDESYAQSHECCAIMVTDNFPNSRNVKILFDVVVKRNLPFFSLPFEQNFQHSIKHSNSSRLKDKSSAKHFSSFKSQQQQKQGQELSGFSLGKSCNMCHHCLDMEKHFNEYRQLLFDVDKMIVPTSLDSNLMMTSYRDQLDSDLYFLVDVQKTFQNVCDSMEKIRNIELDDEHDWLAYMTSPQNSPSFHIIQELTCICSFFHNVFFRHSNYGEKKWFDECCFDVPFQNWKTQSKYWSLFEKIASKNKNPHRQLDNSQQNQQNDLAGGDDSGQTSPPLAKTLAITLAQTLLSPLSPSPPPLAKTVAKTLAKTLAKTRPIPVIPTTPIQNPIVSGKINNVKKGKKRQLKKKKFELNRLKKKKICEDDLFLKSRNSFQKQTKQNSQRSFFAFFTKFGKSGQFVNRNHIFHQRHFLQKTCTITKHDELKKKKLVKSPLFRTVLTSWKTKLTSRLNQKRIQKREQVIEKVEMKKKNFQLKKKNKNFQLKNKKKNDRFDNNLSFLGESAQVKTAKTAKTAKTVPPPPLAKTSFLEEVEKREQVKNSMLPALCLPSRFPNTEKLLLLLAFIRSLRAYEFHLNFKFRCLYLFFLNRYPDISWAAILYVMFSLWQSETSYPFIIFFSLSKFSFEKAISDLLLQKERRYVTSTTLFNSTQQPEKLTKTTSQLKTTTQLKTATTTTTFLSDDNNPFSGFLKQQQVQLNQQQHQFPHTFSSSPISFSALSSSSSSCSAGGYSPDSFAAAKAAAARATELFLSENDTDDSDSESKRLSSSSSSSSSSSFSADLAESSSSSFSGNVATTSAKSFSMETCPSSVPPLTRERVKLYSHPKSPQVLAEKDDNIEFETLTKKTFTETFKLTEDVLDSAKNSAKKEEEKKKCKFCSFPLEHLKKMWDCLKVDSNNCGQLSVHLSRTDFVCQNCKKDLLTFNQDILFLANALSNVSGPLQADNDNFSSPIQSKSDKWEKFLDEPKHFRNLDLSNKLSLFIDRIISDVIDENEFLTKANARADEEGLFPRKS